MNSPRAYKTPVVIIPANDPIPSTSIIPKKNPPDKRVKPKHNGCDHHVV